GLQDSVAADVLERKARRDELQYPLLLRHLFLLAEDLEKRGFVEGLAGGEDLGDQVADLVGRESAHRERQPPHRRFVDLEAEAPPQVSVQNLRDLAVVREVV